MKTKILKVKITKSILEQMGNSQKCDIIKGDCLGYFRAEINKFSDYYLINNDGYYSIIEKGLLFEDACKKATLRKRRSLKTWHLETDYDDFKTAYKKMQLNAKQIYV